MGKLSGAIVQRRLASLRDVEEALARQVLYGGDLATNLLEQAPSMDEGALLALLAETHSLPAARTGELPRSGAEARSHVPGDVALRHGLYPLEQSEGKLVVAVSEPLRSDVEQDLAFALGVTIEQRIAPFVRIRQAISRDYGLPLDRRSQRVLAKLEGKPDPSPSIAPSPLEHAPDMASLPRPPSIPALGLPAPMDMAPLYGAGAKPVAPPAPTNLGPPIAGMMPVVIPAPEIHTTGPSEPSPPPPDGVSIHERLTSPAPPVTPNKDEETAPWHLLGVPTDAAVAARVTAPAPAPVPSGAVATPTAAAVAQALPAPGARRPGSGKYAAPAANLAAWRAESKQAERRGRARHRGPYTAAAAEQDLMAAEGRDGVLSAFFGFVHQYFEYSVLFAVHGDLAEGRDAHGPGADHAKITGIGVPLDLPGSLATARREARFVIAPLAKDGLDARLALDLERRASKKVLLLPILVRNRCVLIFYGDDGADDVDLSEIGDVIAFAPLVAAALESVILRKKTAVRHLAGEDGSDAKRAPGASLRPRLTLPTREERAEALALALESTVRPVQEPSEPPPPRRTMTPPPLATEAFGTAAEGSKGEPKRSSTQPAIPSVRAAHRAEPPQELAPPARPPTPSQGTPVHASTPPPEGGTPGPVFSLSRRLATAMEVPPDDGWDEKTRSSKPARPIPTLRDEAPDISIGASEVDWSPADDEMIGIPDSQVVVAAQLPIKRHSSAELRLPTVIVNIDSDLEVLVRRLVEGDETALVRLVQHGAAAASLLVSRFPGPLTADADPLAVPELASHRGPLLRGLVMIGHASVPFLAVRSNDSDPVIRAWATRLLGEIPSSDSAQAVGRRVTDSHADVRRAALEAGKLLQTDEDARTALRDRVLTLAEEATSPVEPRVAAIEAIAHFRDGRSVPRLVRLVAHNDEVGQSAQWALGVITRQTFARDVAAWEGWWKDYADNHRIEWLIDALMHDEAEIRRAAGEELKALTKEYFGYYDDLAKSERGKAQKRYLEWWEATGKGRFSDVGKEPAPRAVRPVPTEPPRGRVS